MTYRTGQRATRESLRKRMRRQVARPFWWLGNKIADHRPYRGPGGYYDARVTFQAASEAEAMELWDEIMGDVLCHRPEGCRFGMGSLHGPFTEDDDEGKELAKTFLNPMWTATSGNPTTYTYSTGDAS